MTRESGQAESDNTEEEEDAGTWRPPSLFRILLQGFLTGRGLLFTLSVLGVFLYLFYLGPLLLDTFAPANRWLRAAILLLPLVVPVAIIWYQGRDQLARGRKLVARGEYSHARQVLSRIMASHHEAALLLGDLYREGLGGERDIDRAVGCYEESLSGYEKAVFVDRVLQELDTKPFTPKPSRRDWQEKLLALVEPLAGEESWEAVRFTADLLFKLERPEEALRYARRLPDGEDERLQRELLAEILEGETRSGGDSDGDESEPAIGVPLSWRSVLWPGFIMVFCLTWIPFFLLVITGYGSPAFLLLALIPPCLPVVWNYVIRGYKYEIGEHCLREGLYPLAAEYFTRALLQNDPRAAKRLGDMALHGWGMVRSPDAAYAAYDKAGILAIVREFQLLGDFPTRGGGADFLDDEEELAGFWRSMRDAVLELVSAGYGKGHQLLGQVYWQIGDGQELRRYARERYAAEPTVANAVAAAEASIRGKEATAADRAKGLKLLRDLAKGDDPAPALELTRIYTLGVPGIDENFDLARRYCRLVLDRLADIPEDEDGRHGPSFLGFLMATLVQSRGAGFFSDGEYLLFFHVPLAAGEELFKSGRSAEAKPYLRQALHFGYPAAGALLGDIAREGKAADRKTEALKWYQVGVLALDRLDGFGRLMIGDIARRQAAKMPGDAAAWRREMLARVLPHAAKGNTVALATAASLHYGLGEMGEAVRAIRLLPSLPGAGECGQRACLERLLCADAVSIPDDGGEPQPPEFAAVPNPDAPYAANPLVEEEEGIFASRGGRLLFIIAAGIAWLFLALGVAVWVDGDAPFSMALFALIFGPFLGGVVYAVVVALQGYASGERYLARKHHAMAARLFSSAVGSLDARAARRLGDMHRDGLGMPVDRDKAYAAYRRSWEILEESRKGKVHHIRPGGKNAVIAPTPKYGTPEYRQTLEALERSLTALALDGHGQAEVLLMELWRREHDQAEMLRRVESVFTLLRTPEDEEARMVLEPEAGTANAADAATRLERLSDDGWVDATWALWRVRSQPGKNTKADIDTCRRLFFRLLGQLEQTGIPLGGFRRFLIRRQGWLYLQADGEITLTDAELAAIFST